MSEEDVVFRRFSENCIDNRYCYKVNNFRRPQIFFVFHSITLVDPSLFFNVQEALLVSDQYILE